MIGNEKRAKSALVDIAKDIDQYVYKACNHPEWAGADVLITSDSSKTENNEGFYQKPRTVVTPYASQVVWLFTCLSEAFDGLIDGTSKNRILRASC